VPQYRKIQAGDDAGARADLEGTRRTLLALLKERLEAMAGVLEQAVPRIEALAAY
jgi:hypothetical protein